MSTQINDVPVSGPTWLLLRDYFAAKALCGYLSGRRDPLDTYSADEVAKECYAYADAMLKAREVKL